MATELVRYSTYEACLDSLLKLGTDKEEVLALLEHERAHFKKAAELGYAPMYGIHMVVDCPPIILAGYIDFNGMIPDGNDMIDILLAPDNPGKDDLGLVAKIRNGFSTINS